MRLRTGFHGLRLVHSIKAGRGLKPKSGLDRSWNDLSTARAELGAQRRIGPGFQLHRMSSSSSSSSNVDADTHEPAFDWVEDMTKFSLSNVDLMLGEQLVPERKGHYQKIVKKIKEEAKLPKEKRMYTLNKEMRVIQGTHDAERFLVLLKESREGLLKCPAFHASMIHLLIQGGNYDECLKLVEEIKAINAKKLSESTWSTIVRCYCVTNQFEKAVATLDEMRSHDVPPRQRTFVVLLESICSTAKGANELELLDKYFQELKETAETAYVPAKSPDLKAYLLALEICTKVALAASEASDTELVNKSLDRFEFYLTESMQDLHLHDQNSIKLIQTRIDSFPSYPHQIHQMNDAPLDFEEGTCGHCKQKLRVVKLPNDVYEDFIKVADEFVSDKMEKPEQRKAWSVFKKMVREYAEGKDGGVDLVVDCANVAWFGRSGHKNGFSWNQLKEAVDCLDEMGKKYLLIIHPHNFKSGQQKHERKAFEAIRKKQRLFTIPYGSNDDWFWLYAGVYLRNAYVLSNDEMRDHFFELFQERYLHDWKDRTLAHYTFDHNGLQIQYPTKYSRRAQVFNHDGTKYFHIPYSLEENIITSDVQRGLARCRPSNIVAAGIKRTHREMEAQSGEFVRDLTPAMLRQELGRNWKWFCYYHQKK